MKVPGSTISEPPVDVSDVVAGKIPALDLLVETTGPLFHARQDVAVLSRRKELQNNIFWAPATVLDLGVDASQDELGSSLGVERGTLPPAVDVPCAHGTLDRPSEVDSPPLAVGNDLSNSALACHPGDDTSIVSLSE